jgi:hypothetical protein
MRDQLELHLSDLATAVAWPATPDLASSVGATIRSGRERRALARGWPLPGWGPARRGLVLAAAAALLVAGVAAGIGFALGGLRITFGEPPATMSPSSVAERALGAPVTLEEARARAGFTPRVPSLPVLGPPDHVFFTEPPAGGQVSMVWGERAGYPADPSTDIGLVMTQFSADIGPETFEKLLSSGTRLDPVELGDGEAYWIEGGDHFIFYRDARGMRVETTIRMVGDTLVWESGGLTLRLEGAPNLPAALRVAESLGD